MTRRRFEAPAAPPTHPIEETAYQRIKRLVWESLAQWERHGAPGSARPVFERAWVNALRLEGYDQTLQLAIVREKLYQRWLGEGAPLTAASREEILRTRPRARAILDGLGIVQPPRREPGQEG